MFTFTQASKELQQAQTSRPESTQIQPQPGEKGRNPERERDGVSERGGQRLGAGDTEEARERHSNGVQRPWQGLGTEIQREQGRDQDLKERKRSRTGMTRRTETQREREIPGVG